MTRLIIAIPLALMASTASAENICYRQMNPLDYQCRYDATRNRCDCREIKHGEGNRPQSRPTPEPEPERPEPEPGGHWATRDNEPDSRTDPEGHRDWQRDRDAQREEGTW